MLPGEPLAWLSVPIRDWYVQKPVFRLLTVLTVNIVNQYCCAYFLKDQMTE